MLGEVSSPINNFSQTFQPKNNLSINDVDHFWADCFSNLSKTMRTRNHQRQLSNETQRKCILQLYTSFPSLKNEEEKTCMIENRKKEAMQKCRRMYIKAKEFHHKRQTLIEQVNMKKINNELSPCTWKPQVNKERNNQIVNKIGNNQENKIYFRAVDWEYQKQIKQTKRKADNEINEMYNLSFKPEVNLNPDLVSVFKKGPDIHDNVNNHAFFFRYNKARIEERERKELRDKGITNSGKKMRRCHSNVEMPVNTLKLSKGDSYKQTIHKELLNLELPGSDDDWNHS